MNDPISIVFVCTGNACRSQMAEGFARVLGGPAVAAASAGIEAHGLDPRAVAVMAEVGIDIQGQASQRLDDVTLEHADVVVTVCGHADEHCPVLPPGTQRRHWPLMDPARASGSRTQVTAIFRNVRDEVRERVAGLLEELDIAVDAATANEGGRA